MFPSYDRTIILDGEERNIFHFHFLGWPDHGTPEDPGSVLNFLHDVNLKQVKIEIRSSSRLLTLFSFRTYKVTVDKLFQLIFFILSVAGVYPLSN